VIGALEDALTTHAAPAIVHSDQGSEYDSEDCTSFVRMIGAELSMRAKASPWQHGYQESFYSHFTAEAGDLNRFETLGELIECMYHQMYYYNYQRIHSVLKMTPVEFRTRHTV
jgi:putative transposase